MTISPKSPLRWTMLVRLLAMMLVQWFLLSCLLKDNVLTRYWVLDDKWFSTPHWATVIFAAIVADVCLCGIILLLRWDNLLLVVIATLFAVLGSVLGLCLTPRISGYGPTGLTNVYIGAFLGWFGGCLLASRFRVRASPLEKPQLQFTLAEILVATLIAAIGAWLLSWTL